MYSNHPDAPTAGNWLANTYAPYNQVQPVYSVGYGVTQNPFASQDTRRTMFNAYGYAPNAQVSAPTPVSAPLQPFSSYPPATSTPATSSLNAFALSTQSNGNTAAVTQNNPWATNTALPAAMPSTPAPFTTPMTAAPANPFGYGQVVPTMQNIEFPTTAWDKKSGSPWPQTAEFTMQTPNVNWGVNNATPNVNGYYAPTYATTPQYPTQYNTTPVTSDWSTICETNFKEKF